MEARDELEIGLSAPVAPPEDHPDRPVIRVDAAVREWIDAFAREDTCREVAGVLLGNVAVRRGRSAVQVLAAVEAKHTQSDQASVTFTHDTWEDINSVRDKQHPQLRIVGWFHTHPGFGVFLSEWDLFIHGNFFDRPWQIAYVVDPLDGTSGFFRWEDGEVRSVGDSAGLVSSRSRRDGREPAPSAAAPSLFRRCAPVAAGFAAGAVTTALVFSVWFRAPASGPPPLAPPPVLTTAPAPAASPRTYVVKRGESLWRIARRFYGDGRYAQGLAEANGIADADLVPEGGVLRLPRPAEIRRATARPSAAGTESR